MNDAEAKVAFSKTMAVLVARQKACRNAVNSHLLLLLLLLVVVDNN